jgi:hypothetical protein
MSAGKAPSSIVQDEECGSWIICKDSLNAEECLERVSMHPQMAFNRYGAALDECSWQDASQIGFDRVTMDEDDDSSEAGSEGEFDFRFCRSNAVEVAVIDYGRAGDEASSLCTCSDRGRLACACAAGGKEGISATWL